MPLQKLRAALITLPQTKTKRMITNRDLLSRYLWYARAPGVCLTILPHSNLCANTGHHNMHRMLHYTKHWTTPCYNQSRNG